jgi:hypothetical protein
MRMRALFQEKGHEKKKVRRGSSPRALCWGLWPSSLSLLAFSAAIVLSGCGRGDDPTIITTARIVQPPATPAGLGVASPLSLDPGKDTSPSCAHSGGTHDGCSHTESDAKARCCSDKGAEKPIDASSPGLAWQKPGSWLESEGRPMRLATFTFGGSTQAECYIAVLPGPAGGLAANINRWQSQMGHEPLSDEGIEALQQIIVLGDAAHVVEITGAFTGMDGKVQPESSMLGVIRRLPDRTVFVKMTGPRREISAERENFLAFCASLDTKKREA